MSSIIAQLEMLRAHHLDRGDQYTAYIISGIIAKLREMSTKPTPPPGVIK